MIWEGLERKRSWPSFNILFRDLKEVSKAIKTLSQLSWSSDWDLNSGCPEYKICVLETVVSR